MCGTVTVWMGILALNRLSVTERNVSYAPSTSLASNTQFQSTAAGKLRSPKRVRILGTMHVSTSAERRRQRYFVRGSQDAIVSKVKWRQAVQHFCDFLLYCFFLDPAPRWNRRTDSYAEWLKWRVFAQGSAFWGSGRWGKYSPKTLQKGAWIGSFKPKRQNLYIAISPQLLIRRSSDLKTEFGPSWVVRHYPKANTTWLTAAILKIDMTSYFSGGCSDLDEIRQPDANDTPITAKWSRSKPKAEFQYGGRLYFETANGYISTKFGLVIDIDRCWPIVDVTAFRRRQWHQQIRNRK